jgi:bidirectional [NiFe] hydrogenase diaphorase subunit
MPVKTLTINGQMLSARAEQTILEVADEANIRIPTLCRLQGVHDVGACRLCLVEVAGSGRLLPACVTPVHEIMAVTTHSPRLQAYRKMIVELLFAERNHICAVCVANNHCELQDLAIEMGVDHVRYEYLYPKVSVDISHEQFGIDHNGHDLAGRLLRVPHVVPRPRRVADRPGSTGGLCLRSIRRHQGVPGTSRCRPGRRSSCQRRGLAADL